jgi:hypothetical protein
MRKIAFLALVLVSGCAPTVQQGQRQIPTDLKSTYGVTTVGRPLDGLVKEDLLGKTEAQIVTALGKPFYVSTDPKTGGRVIAYVDGFCKMTSGVGQALVIGQDGVRPAPGPAYKTSIGSAIRWAITYNPDGSTRVEWSQMPRAEEVLEEIKKAGGSHCPN